MAGSPAGLKDMTWQLLGFIEKSWLVLALGSPCAPFSFPLAWDPGEQVFDSPAPILSISHRGLFSFHPHPFFIPSAQAHFLPLLLPEDPLTRKPSRHLS